MLIPKEIEKEFIYSLILNDHKKLEAIISERKIDYERVLSVLTSNRIEYFVLNRIENNLKLNLLPINFLNELKKNYFKKSLPTLKIIEKVFLLSEKLMKANIEHVFLKGISLYNPKLHTGTLRTIMIRNNNAGEFMVIVQFQENNKRIIDLILNFLKNSFKEIKSLNYIINKKVNDSIYDQKIINYSGEKSIDEKINNLRFKINPKSFFQTNTNQTLNLYKVVRKFAKLTGNELVYDLYCGLGTISQFLADSSKKIIGIESVKDAICSARKSVSANKINNVEFVVGDMRKVLNGGLFSKYGRPDLLITDPPRDGMHKDVIKQILKILPKKIIYVSCNPATQIRDLDLLLNHFKISKIQPVDMFPHTDHVENVVLLKLKNKFSCTN